MESTHAETIWEIGMAGIKWVLGAFVATVMFMLKGYHREFEELKKSNSKLIEMVEHLNLNLKNYDNGSKSNLSAIIELEKDFACLKTEIELLKEMLKK